MLRARPEHCPLCGHDVRGVVRCAGCGERLLVAASAAPRPPGTARRAAGAAGAVLAGASLGIVVAAAAVVQPLAALAIVASVPVGVGVGGALTRGARSAWSRLRRRRARTEPPPSDESVIEARQSLATEPSADVSVRGRVRVEIPAMEDTDHALVAGTAGRFVIEAREGEALIDDDRVEVDPGLVLRDGDLVEVTGPARLAVDDAGVDYRASRSRIVFAGTEARPLRIRRINRSRGR